ncbi:hypothetical protein [Pseudoalteromonas sp. GutCa3]|uniref:hypothetical protein n=1 Tax=Pseudoalteromonas sp. GutCa3 TaxID=888433 RepID=UPI000C347F3B|nr:hypothetical protein [Pseudoalteromonas sp. GutCa3]PKG68667.1 hypothetical protein CXF64_20310 [Pseudoalteromonas sp. GutCa3]
MNIDLLITIAAAIVLANLINKTVVNPLLNKIFGGNSKVESGSSKGFKSSACSRNLQEKK